MIRHPGSYCQSPFNNSALVYFMAAMVCKIPPAMAQMAINHGHAPPCRLRASAMVTVLNQRAVDGRVRRQVIKGEKMTRIISVTSGQKFPTLMLLYRPMSETMPTRESSALATTCILSAQLRPRRIISPKSAMPKATGQETTNTSTLPRVGLTPGTLKLLGELKNVNMIGVNRTCTARPQSKATAMPMPCGAGSPSWTPASAVRDCSVSFKAAFPFISPHQAAHRIKKSDAGTEYPAPLVKGCRV